MRLLPLLFIITLLGCSSKQIYTFDIPDTHDTKSIHQTIAIATITLPNSMQQQIQKQNGIHIHTINDALWQIHPQEILTSTLKKYLQAKSNAPVLLYPWNTQKEDILVEIVIDDFISKNDIIHLNGSYTITNAHTRRSKQHVFDYTKATNTLTANMIKDMNTLYLQLCLDIANKLSSRL